MSYTEPLRMLWLGKGMRLISTPPPKHELADEVAELISEVRRLNEKLNKLAERIQSVDSESIKLSSAEHQ